MNIFIDTSNSYIIFVVFDDDNVIVSKTIKTNRNQAEIFFDEYENFLKEDNLKIDDFNAFYFGAGPGSFTGIRVGLSIAKALKVSGHDNVYTINSLYLLVDDYQNSKVAIDARGNKSYYLELQDEKETKYGLFNNDDLNLEKAKTYDNSLSKIPDNVIKAINHGKYSEKIESVYLKKAF
jgi:tRNA threonylcarbamoyladenosine biosynthesis protein TsaB